VSWGGSGVTAIGNHETNDCGLRVTGSEIVFINGIVANVNNAGEAPAGTGDTNTGTDAVKLSVVAGMIQGLVAKGCSRDVVDAFTSGGPITIDGVWSDTFYINVIEIKQQLGIIDPTKTPRDINISNVYCGAGGKHHSDIYAGIFIFNGDSPEVPNRSPRRINLSNINIRGIGYEPGVGDYTTSGIYHGALIDGSYDVSFSNVKLNQARNFGISASNCENLTFSNSVVHGRGRGLNVKRCTSVEIANSHIGRDTETGEEAGTGVFFSGETAEFSSFGGAIYGTSNSVRGENATVVNYEAQGTKFLGAWRLDAFTNAKIQGGNVDSRSATLNGLKSGSFGVSGNLKVMGTTIQNSQLGVSEDNLTTLQCIGVTFKDCNTTLGGTGTGNTIVSGCISDGSGPFRAEAGADIIVNNIVLA
jgi:hypothetical protein